MIHLLELDACFKSLLKGTQWRNEQFVFKTIRRQQVILGPFFRVLVVHQPVQTREVGWACRVALQQNTRYMRNETERLNPQNLSVVVISDTPCTLAMMRCQAGWSEIRSVYRTFWHCLNSSSTASMVGVAKFAWAMPNLVSKELTRNQGWCSSIPISQMQS